MEIYVRITFNISSYCVAICLVFNADIFEPDQFKWIIMERSKITQNLLYSVIRQPLTEISKSFN